jgi:hypothetical protein
MMIIGCDLHTRYQQIAMLWGIRSKMNAIPV